ncbi:MAG: hypothetical protein IIV76_00060 [Alistipes sp.]|nr:hypothetical protein [Alistipes sp.]
MNDIRHISIWLTTLLLIFSVGMARADRPTFSARFSKDSVEVGDQVEYILDIEKDRATEIGIPDFDGNPTPEQIQSRAKALEQISTFKEYDQDRLELIEDYPIDTIKVEGRRLHLRKRYRLAVMETGDMHLRPTILYFEKNREYPDTLYSPDTLTLSVARYEDLDTLSFLVADMQSQQGFKVDSLLAAKQLRTEGINTQKDLPFKFIEIRDYVIYGAVALIILSLIIWLVASLLYRYMRRRETEVRVMPKLPAHVVANKALVELNNRKLWQNGKFKQYYTALTSIIRVYISDRWGISALELTTDETIEALHDIEMPLDSRMALVAMLRTADMVKFAKAEPEAEENEENYIRAYYFVENTKLVDEAQNEGKEDITIDTNIGE